MDGTDLLTEMEAYVTEGANAAAEADAENALPFESIDDYSTEPASFSEMSLKMMDVVETVFDLAAVYNRRSPEYLKSCAQLERGIRYLGSCCLTKVALESKDHPLPELGQLSTDKLYGMASFHFRKLDRALHEYIDEKHAVDDDLLDMEYRFFHLLQRLRSTEVKIYNYDFRRWYETEDYAPVVKGLAFSKDTMNRGAHDRPKVVAPAFHRAPAFPLEADASLKLKAKSSERCADAQGSGTRDQGSVEIGMSTEPASNKNSEIRNKKYSAQGAEESSEPSTQYSKEIGISAAPISEEEDGLMAGIEVIRKNPKAPKFMKVLGDAMERSAKSGEGGPVLTPEEAAFLASDPEFREFDPEFAHALSAEREALRECEV
ncbi:MAG: hypothetical protein IJI07_03465 [Flexilinea sp.]|nr:hypothetical protein [Flexilinea sp.]